MVRQRTLCAVCGCSGFQGRCQSLEDECGDAICFCDACKKTGCVLWESETDCEDGAPIQRTLCAVCGCSGFQGRWHSLEDECGDAICFCDACKKTGCVLWESETDSEDGVPIQSREGFTVAIMRVSGEISNISGVVPTMTLSMLCVEVETHLGLAGGTTSLCLGDTCFSDDNLASPVNELGIADGSILTCVSVVPQLIPCPSSGWQYVDPKGQVQGPFSLTEMTVWYRMGYFRPTLLMRYHSSLPFVKFADLFAKPRVPFESPVKPPYESHAAPSAKELS